MGKELFDAYACARSLLQRADDILHEKISAKILDGPQEALTDTRIAQPALMIICMAVLEVLKKEMHFSLGENVSCVAGHSLGEFTAATAAGALDFDVALRLLKLRGQAMAEAFPREKSAMAAVLKLPLDVFQEYSVAPEKICVVANDNSEGQYVVSGHKEAIEDFSAWATQRGGRVIALDVSGPFHSPLMQPARVILEEVLGKVPFREPTVPILTNVSAAPQSDPKILRWHLLNQTTQTVRWREIMDTIVSSGVQQVFEVGPKRVLSGLFRKQHPELEVMNLQTPQDIENFMKNYSLEKEQKAASS
jgi:[acyl-carrier-protein] S-malonyltransferase